MTITREQAQKIIEAASEAIAENGTNYRTICDKVDHLNYVVALPDVVLELARIALAGMEAEPVAYMNRFTGRVFTVEEQPGADTDAQVYVPVYAAPQPLTTSERAELENYRNAQQVVPEWTNEQCLEFLSIAFRHAEIKGDLEMDDIRLGVKMVNACRAAMLHGDK